MIQSSDVDQSQQQFQSFELKLLDKSFQKKW